MTTRTPKRKPCVLTVAGSDSGGGAGIQADLHTFAAFGVHGASAITCVTAQTPGKVSHIAPVSVEVVGAQIESVVGALKPRAVKVGMLYSARLVEVVADRLGSVALRSPVVVDPVLVSSSGRVLLQSSAFASWRRHLLPLATLLTPNVHEAEILSGRKIRTPEEMRRAARVIVERQGVAVLVKGGHLKTGSVSMDVFYDGRDEYLLSAPRTARVDVHGTGCTLAAAIAASLAQGHGLLTSVQLGKEFTARAIGAYERVGRERVLGWDAASGC